MNSWRYGSSGQCLCSMIQHVTIARSRFVQPWVRPQASALRRPQFDPLVERHRHLRIAKPAFAAPAKSGKIRAGRTTFFSGKDGRRPVYGGDRKFQEDPQRM
jgi:hypothetical protein